MHCVVTKGTDRRCCAYASLLHTRAVLCVLRPLGIRAETCEHFPPAWTERCGSQAFYSTTSFGANIGAWNTVSLTSLYQVCAAFGRRRTLRRARSVGARCGAALVRDGTADVRAHVCLCT